MRHQTYFLRKEPPDEVYWFLSVERKLSWEGLEAGEKEDLSRNLKT